MDTEVETRSLLNEEQDEFNINELNTQMLRQIIDSTEQEKMSQKVAEHQLNILSQSEAQQTSSLQEEQTKILSQLIAKNEELTNLTENEALMRVNLFVVVEKMKTKIQKFKTFYNIIRQTIEKSSTIKNNSDYKFQDLTQQLQNYKTKINSKVNNLVSSNSELINQLKNEKSAFQKYKMESEFIQNKQNVEITNIKYETMKLIEEFMDKEKLFKESLEEKDILIRQKENIINEANNLIEKGSNRIVELENKNEELKKEILEMEAAQKEDKNMIVTLQQKSADLEKLLDMEKLTIEDLKAKNAELKKLVDEIFEAQNTITQMTADYNSLKTKLNASNEQTTILKNTIAELNEKYSNIETTIQNSKEDYESQLDKLNQELHEKINETNEIQAKLNDLEKKSSTNIEQLQERFDDCFIEKENLKNVVERLKEEKEEMRNDYNKKFENVSREHDKKIKKLENESNKIIKESAEQIQKYTNEIEMSKETIKKLELKTSELQVSKKNLETMLNQKIQETQNLVQEKTETENQNKSQKPLSSGSNSSEPIKMDKILPFKKLEPKFKWDDSSDSSYEPDYSMKKPKLIQKRKVQPPEKRTKMSNEEIFNSLCEGSLMFKQPKMPPSKPAKRKPFF